jgi:hypothetical protein
VRELERQVDAHDSQPDEQPVPRPADQTAALEALAERITPLFGPCPVQIVPSRHGSYELQVGFHDFIALTAAVTRLTEEPASSS